MRIIGLAAVAALLVSTAPALAQGRGHEGGHRHEFAEHGDAGRQLYPNDRYDDRGRGCPPGLAKKHNGCLPPGRPRRGYGYDQRAGRKDPITQAIRSILR